MKNSYDDMSKSQLSIAADCLYQAQDGYLLFYAHKPLVNLSFGI